MKVRILELADGRFRVEHRTLWAWNFISHYMTLEDAQRALDWYANLRKPVRVVETRTI